ncbi:hypothetical protein WDV06_27935 [Streptomyces racemochromogenes]|uniref:Adhesin domain-containing protein n=1 Tax=Streptomyces racemochromogenes TaxID=67353 RepID=A0ABW7PKF0_9ACTN
MSHPTGPGRPSAPAAPDLRVQRLAWYTAAALSAVLVVVAAGWQVRVNAGARAATVTGGSAGRTVSALEVVGGEADVTITPGGDGAVAYRAEMSWTFRKPDVEESWLGDTLKLVPRCPGDELGISDDVGCSVGLAVTVPSGIPVRVSGGSGRVTVSGLAGTVDADMGSGGLVLADLRGPVRARVGSGTLRATGLTGLQADVRADSGHAQVSFAAPPDRVTGHVGAGRLEVTLPTATRYRVSCRAGAGRCETEEALRDPAAARTLDLEAEAGHAGAVARTTAR